MGDLRTLAYDSKHQVAGGLTKAFKTGPQRMRTLVGGHHAGAQRLPVLDVLTCILVRMVDVRFKAMVSPGVGKRGDTAFNVSRITLIADIIRPCVREATTGRFRVVAMLAAQRLRWLHIKVHREPARMHVPKLHKGTTSFQIY